MIDTREAVVLSSQGSPKPWHTRNCSCDTETVYTWPVLHNSRLAAYVVVLTHKVEKKKRPRHVGHHSPREPRIGNGPEISSPITNANDRGLMELTSLRASWGALMAIHQTSEAIQALYKHTRQANSNSGHRLLTCI